MPTPDHKPCCDACGGTGTAVATVTNEQGMSGVCWDCHGTGCAHAPVLDHVERAAEAWAEFRDGPDYQPTDRYDVRPVFEAGFAAGSIVSRSHDAVADALVASNSDGSTPATSSPVMTPQQTTAVEDALRELDPEEETWPTGEQIEVIAHALSTTKVVGPDAPSVTNETPKFYSLPAGRLVEGLSTDDGQDIVSVTIRSNDVTAEVYTPRPDNLELDEHNRDNSEMRIYNAADDVDLAIFPDTKVDGREPPTDSNLR